MGAPPTTRDRILDSALELFAERGFAGTSIGEIESAAGLSPRSGGLYKHFPSKLALLEAALDERMREIDEFDTRLDLPLGDLRAELTLAARWGLAELRRERRLVRLVMKEGDRIPDLSARFHETIVRRGHQLATHAIARYGEAAGREIADPEAMGQVICDALVGYSLQEAMFGEGSAAVEEERFIAALVDFAATYVETPEGSPTHA